MRPFFGTPLFILTKPIQVNRPDIITTDKRRTITELSITVDNKISADVSEKRSKYKDPEMEIEKM